MRSEGIFFDPALFLNIAEKGKIFEDRKTSILRVYLLTHCIIGESSFYARGIKRHMETYEEMFIELERLISDNYEDITLDNKVEFLVCTKLFQKSSYLENRIFLDTLAAFDNEKQIFLENKKSKIKDAFRKGEHRNVLALMAFYLENRLDKI